MWNEQSIKASGSSSKLVGNVFLLFISMMLFCRNSEKAKFAIQKGNLNHKMGETEIRKVPLNESVKVDQNVENSSFNGMRRRL